MNAAKQRYVLVAEDEMMIAMVLGELLEGAGYRVVLAGRLAKGLELAGSEPVDAAILDINLAGQNSYPLADALRRRNIPFMFTSGYNGESLPEAYRDVVILQKPYDMSELYGALDMLLLRESSAG